MKTWNKILPVLMLYIRNQLAQVGQPRYRESIKLSVKLILVLAGLLSIFYINLTSNFPKTVGMVHTRVFEISEVYGWNMFMCSRVCNNGSQYQHFFWRRKCETIKKYKQRLPIDSAEVYNTLLRRNKLSKVRLYLLPLFWKRRAVNLVQRNTNIQQ